LNLGRRRRLAIGQAGAWVEHKIDIQKAIGKVFTEVKCCCRLASSLRRGEISGTMMLISFTALVR
jgi:hypothetical protein